MTAGLATQMSLASLLRLRDPPAMHVASEGLAEVRPSAPLTGTDFEAAAPHVKKMHVSVDIAALAADTTSDMLKKHPEIPSLMASNRLKVSALKFSDGRAWLVTNTVTAGGFGKVRCAMAGGRQLIIKDLNPSDCIDKRSRWFNNRPQPTMDPAALEKEYAMMRCFGEAEGVVFTSKKAFLVMPARNGTVGDAARKMAESPTLRSAYDQAVVSMARQMARGLRGMHAKCLLHRDIKPDNALIASDASVHLSDFGGVGRVGDQDLAGTLRYMAPETMFGQPQSDKTDVFSLGRSVREMLDPQRIHLDFPSTLEPKRAASLTHLAETMVALEQNQRPSIDDVIHVLDTIQPPDSEDELRAKKALENVGTELAQTPQNRSVSLEQAFATLAMVERAKPPLPCVPIIRCGSLR
jgi:hypothetical protein